MSSPSGAARSVWRTLILTVGVLVACSRPNPPLAAPGTSPDGAGLSRLGVKVALPEGWTAQGSAEGSLRAGPPGRVVLRVDRAPDAGLRLPSPEALRSGFASGLKLLTVREMGVTRSDDFTAVKLTLGRGGKFDGGTLQQEAFILLAAKRVGADLFLCATVPGTSEGELEAAGRVCGALGSSRGSAGLDGGG